AISSIRLFAEEHGDFYIPDRKRVIDEAFTILFFRFRFLHLIMRDPNPGEGTIAVKVRERRTEQTHLSGGVSEIDAACALRGISTGHYQFASQGKCVGVRTFKHERAGIGEQSRVQACCDFRGDCDSAGAAETVDEFSRGYSARIDPVHVGEIAPADVVINADQETI